MTTISFWARGDNSGANNPALNVEGTNTTPTTQLTFDSGATGDVKLDYNGGGIDTNTSVIIGGTSYDFSVQFVGTLPLTNKLSNVAGADIRGKEIIVISVVDYPAVGETQRFFFLTDGTGTFTIMEAFPNGAHSIDNFNDMPVDPVLICFCSGTMIATPDGERPVEDLAAGDMVLTASGAAKPLIWTGLTRLSRERLRDHPEQWPVTIPAGALAPRLPERDLSVSAQHRVVIEGAVPEMLFGAPRVLVAAKHLLGALARSGAPTGEVVYHHLLLEDHELLVSNGLASESYQPGAYAMSRLNPEMRRALQAVIAAHGGDAMIGRPDALPSLKAEEGRLLAARVAAATRSDAQPLPA
ncbi:MAG: Hint domain-containing protein [Rhodobacteraceae bacterium]|nr:Hint domain-containing protein [Paracoccaceae bacterium]